MKKVMALMMTLMFGFGLAGCNTISGAGKDIEKGGEAIHNSDEENKTY